MKPAPMIMTINVYLTLTGTLIKDPTKRRSAGQGIVLGIQTLRLEAAGGIIAGLLAAFCCDRWARRSCWLRLLRR